MTYREVFDRYVASASRFAFAKVYCRPADCVPTQLAVPMECEPRPGLEYQVRLFDRRRRVGFVSYAVDVVMTRLLHAPLLPLVPRIRTSSPRYGRYEETRRLSGYERTVESAYRDALRTALWHFSGVRSAGWGSPEECEVYMAAAGLV